MARRRLRAEPKIDQRATTRLSGFFPAQGPPRAIDGARGLAGGLLGVLAAGLVERLALGSAGRKLLTPSHPLGNLIVVREWT